MTYIVYLDEFGHIGPFVDRRDRLHNDSPVFGLAGYILPVTEVRSFGTWFYQRKCDLLKWEIERAGRHPAVWEKKGSSLYTVQNVTKYRELRVTTNRLFNQIERCGGRTFYVGLKKNHPPAAHDPNRLYFAVLREAIKRLNAFCEDDVGNGTGFILALDEHDQRQHLLTEASRQMYGTDQPMRCLVEPPFQLESHRYQTMQAADWIAGLIGRLGAIWAEPEQYDDYGPFRMYFEARVNRSAIRSGIRTVRA